jgi:hypothetical protein
MAADDPDLLALIGRHTGEILAVRPSTYGHGSDLTAVVECAEGPFFVKAMRNRPGGRRASLLRERAVSPFVRAVSPALRWAAEDERWIALGFEVVGGLPSGITPGSPDLPVVVDLLDAVGRLELPPVARGWHETRWDRYAADAAEAALFRGDALLHTDPGPDNFLVGGPSGWVVDWAWPTRGAAFIDPACLVVQLIAAGHSAGAAERWVSGSPAWKSADPRAVNAFARATVRMYRHFAERSPDAGWLTAMVAAATAWARHRGVRAG